MRGGLLEEACKRYELYKTGEVTPGNSYYLVNGILKVSVTRIKITLHGS